MAILQLVDSMITALLPIATTALAAATTTALTEAYAGDEQAQHTVLPLVIATALVGALTLVWNSVNRYLTEKIEYAMRAKIEDMMIEKLGSLPFYLYDDQQTIDLYEKADRFSTRLVYVFSTVGDIVSSIFGIIAAVLALGAVSWWLALIVFLATIPGAIIQIRLARKETQHWNNNTVTRRRQSEIGWTVGNQNIWRKFGYMAF